MIPPYIENYSKFPYNDTIMIRFLAICTIICTIAGCATFDNPQTSADQTANHIISYPESNSLIFIGVSGLQLKQEQEIEAALEDAARKASMYHGLAASFVAVQGVGTNALDYYAGSDFYMEYDTRLDPYKDKLTYNPKQDIIYGNGAVYIRFSYPASSPANINYSQSKELDGSPGWIRRPPQEIGGFMAQVGYARRQQRLRDTITKANEDAIAGLIARSSSSINTSVTSYNDISSSVITQQSSGNLFNFMVLETWIDPDNLSVYTLTIARSTR